MFHPHSFLHCPELLDLLRHCLVAFFFNKCKRPVTGHKIQTRCDADLLFCLFFKERKLKSVFCCCCGGGKAQKSVGRGESLLLYFTKNATNSSCYSVIVSWTGMFLWGLLTFAHRRGRLLSCAPWPSLRFRSRSPLPNHHRINKQQEGHCC